MSPFKFIKKFSTQLSLITVLFIIIISNSLSNQVNLGPAEVKAECDVVVYMGGENPGTCSNTPDCWKVGWCVCIANCGGGSTGGTTGGGGSNCSAQCSGWDAGGNYFEKTCGAPNTCYTGDCGSPCDSGCADRNNCNIC